MRPSTLVIASLLILASCAGTTTQAPKHNTGEIYQETEKQYAFLAKSYWRDYQRLYKIAYPVLKSNTELCPDKTGYSLGAVIGTKDSIDTWQIDDRDIVARTVGADDFLRILSVAPQSAAKKYGLQPGDAIVAVNGKQTSYGDDAFTKFYRLVDSEMDKENGSIKLQIMRGGTKKEIAVTPDTICAYGVELEPKGDRNAFADGERIVFSSSIMRFFDNDEKLALVVGHEIAHNVMKHADIRKNNVRVGAILGGIITAATGINVINSAANAANGSNQDKREAEADYVGTYLTARAGYSIADAADTWRQMSLDDPASVTHGGSHPPHAERFLAIEKTVAEINKKRRLNLPLLPNMEEETSSKDGANSAND